MPPTSPDPAPPDRHDWDGDDYQSRMQARTDQLAAAGADAHGEATFVRRFEPATVLDAGCGTGRVAIELARGGIDVVGVDVDASMLATARRLDSTVSWIEADVCALDLGRAFDVVVMAGNVPLFTPPGTQAALVAAAGRHVAPGGRFVAGFSTDWADRPYSLADHRAHVTAAGLAVDEIWSTWDREPWDASSGYVVCVAVRPTVGG